MKHVLVISDLHVGSKFGLSVTAGNEIQNTLGGLWLDMVDNLKAGPKLDAIFMGGDMVDGTNYKAGGKGLDSSDMMEQILEAQELIDLIPDAPTFAVGGSTYHVGNNFNADEVLAKMIGAAYGEELFAQIGNVRAHIAHKVEIGRASCRERVCQYV